MFRFAAQIDRRTRGAKVERDDAIRAGKRARLHLTRRRNGLAPPCPYSDRGESSAASSDLWRGAARATAEVRAGEVYFAARGREGAGARHPDCRWMGMGQAAREGKREPRDPQNCAGEG